LKRGYLALKAESFSDFLAVKAGKGKIKKTLILLKNISILHQQFAQGL
jgi:hypothetical protein